jgi:hypothetical protein
VLHDEPTATQVSTSELQHVVPAHAAFWQHAALSAPHAVHFVPLQTCVAPPTGAQLNVSAMHVPVESQHPEVHVLPAQHC